MREKLSNRTIIKCRSPSKPPKDDKPTLFCSFCGKNQHEVSKLIAGFTVFICNECVELCTQIINEDKNDKSNPINIIHDKLLEVKKAVDGLTHIEEIVYKAKSEIDALIVKIELGEIK